MTSTFAKWSSEKSIGPLDAPRAVSTTLGLLPTLPGGFTYPMVGLGCASGVRRKDVLSALQMGYRLLDTAAAAEWGYSEEDVGRAIQESGLSREELWVQTKIRSLTGGVSEAQNAIEKCLQRLQLQYLDSLLIHKPEGSWREWWQALENFYSKGKVKAIGICDINAELLMGLCVSVRIQPMIVQNFFDPFHQDMATREVCRQRGIVFQGFSTLGTQWRYILGRPCNPVMESTLLKNIAVAHKKSVAQVVLRWALHSGVAVIPASTKEKHRLENWNVTDFTLSADEIRASSH
eukprot:gnl/MRDRNA2_/MRDRNA2_19895_c0_seq1.p1 gnl/MRDRNA2_/MRDRNA2_19895_c0~~gnl/MRDRNA2_/MRDRNA2_19895_c0_seq1.p1  ORF type:complete len:291 (-),score=40.38 gnl/MRDRNA2_/MRDRNA2_19895_c0_seq1:9-881(-)